MNTISSLLEFIASFEPVGSVKMFAGVSAPSKWLICDGSAVSRTTYSQLFSAIGTTYGAGDGSTTFNLPDLRDKVPIGASTNYALGSTGGEATHTLTTAEMPSHGHIASDVSVLYWGTTGSNSVTFQSNGGWKYNTLLSGVIGNTGGGGAHNNMQPYLAINYIIYAGK